MKKKFLKNKFLKKLKKKCLKIKKSLKIRHSLYTLFLLIWPKIDKCTSGEMQCYNFQISASRNSSKFFWKFLEKKIFEKKIFEKKNFWKKSWKKIFEKKKILKKFFLWLTFSSEKDRKGMGTIGGTLATLANHLIGQGRKT